MGKIIKIFLAIFSAYRLASLIASEEGPYLPFLYKDEKQTGVFEWMRIRAGAYVYGSDGLPETNLARGITCPLCVGVYLSLAMVFLVHTPFKINDWLLTWFGVSGAQVFLENLTSDDALKEAIEDVAESIDE